MDDGTISACRAAATKYDVPLSTVMAVVETESGGVALTKVNGKDVPLIRWEGHYFQERLTGPALARARREGLASSKPGVVKNPASQVKRYAMLAEASAINKEAAHESISVGVGQVMGAHDSKLGFKSAVEMLAYQTKGVTQQVEVMMRYCKRFGLIDELQRADYAGFARGYNGPQFRKFGYDQTMEKHAKRWAKLDDADVVDGMSIARPERAAAAKSMLRMGAEGSQVRELQVLLNRAASKYGFSPVEVDGDFGPTTKRAVEAFQRKVGFTGTDVDGIAGPQTMKKLAAFRVDPQEQPGAIGPVEALGQTPEGRQGAGAAVAGTTITAGINEAKDALLPVTGYGGIVDKVYLALTIVGVVLLIGGLIWAGYGWYRARKTRGGTTEA